MKTLLFRVTNKIFYRLFITVLLINLIVSCSPKKEKTASYTSPYIGTTNGSFSVSHDGDAVYKIPILTPPGTNGMAPMLSLSYYSRKKNGPLGMGFRLTGVSSIQRVGATKAQDGFTGSVNYDTLDRFLYDGERLIKTKEYGKDSTVYHTEIESWRKIVSGGNCENGPCWFKVYTKNGYIKEFGTTENSRIKATHKKGVKTWALHKIIDQQGNYIEFSYLKDALNGSHYPSEIKYTGNRNKLTPQRAVKFTYELRSDSITIYEGGSKSKQTKRLKSVTTSVDGENVLSYNLNYQYCETTGRSQLVQVKECDALEQCLLPTTFKWQQGNPSLIDSKGEDLTMIAKDSDGLFPMDINADGLTDLISLTQRRSEDFQIHTYISDGNQLEKSASQKFSQKNRDGQIMPLDFNGDGKMDLLYAMNTTNTGNGRFSLQLYKSDGEKFENPIAFESDRNITNATGKLVLADVNGDGRTDLVYYSLNSDNFLTIHTYLSNGKTFKLASTQKDVFRGQRSAALIPLDSNGDGMMDFAYSNSNEQTNTLQTYILVAKGSSFILKDPQELQPLKVTNGSKLVTADVNADGMQDLVYVTVQRNNPIRISTFFSNGTTFESGVYKEGEKAHNGQLMTADVNGDEKTDLIIVSTDNSNAFQMDMYLSDGTNFQTSKQIQTTAPRKGIPIPMDLDGDAKTDIIYAILKHDEHRFTKFISAKPYPDLISSFHNGIGGSIKIDYKPLTDTTVHTREEKSKNSTALSAMRLVHKITGGTINIGNQNNGVTGVPLPILNVSYPTYVVANFTKTDGRGNAYTYNHKYEGAKVDLSGRGWLGFHHKIDIDSATNQYSKHTFKQIFPYTGLDVSSTKYRLSDHSKLIRKRSYYTNTFPITGNKRIHQVRRVKRRKDHYSYGKFEYTLATDFQYDHFGNPSLVIKKGDTTRQTHVLYSRFAYENDTINWQIGHLKEIVKSSDANFQNVLLKKELQYNPKNKHIKAVKIWNDQLNVWEKHQYLYDQWGNKTHDISNSNDTVQYVFDQKYHSFLTKTVFPPNENGERLSYESEYEPYFGIKISETDPNANTLTTRIDGIGRTMEVVGPNLEGEDEVLVNYNYIINPDGGYYKKTQSKLDWENDKWHWSIDYFDGLGRLYKSSSIGENLEKTINVEQLFDSKDRVVKQSLPYFSEDEHKYWSSKTYNAYDLLIKKVTPKGEQDSIVTKVDYQEKKIIVHNAVGTPEERKSEIFYDYFSSQRKVTLRINAEGEKTHFTYDAAGRVTSATDPSGILDEIMYNSLNQKVELKNESFGENTYVSNESLRLDKHISANKDTITYKYDKIGRIITHKISEKDSIIYQYDLPQFKNSKGNLSKVILPDGKSWYAYAYDTYGSPESVVFHTNGKEYISKSEYTPGGQVKKFTYPDGAILLNDYNLDGSLKSIAMKDGTEDKTFATFSNYTVFGQPQEVQYRNGVSSEYNYKVDGQLSEVMVTDKNDKILINNALNVNKLKQIVQIKDLLNTTNSQRFKYSKSNRLIAASGKYGDKKYAYDVSGNVILKDSVNYQYENFQVKKGTKDNTIVFSADYDNKGNMIKRVEATDTTKYHYDTMNRLTSVERNGKELFQYGYNHTEQRIEKTDRTNNIRTLYVNPVYEVTFIEEGKILHTKYIKGPSGNIASITKKESQLSSWTNYNKAELKSSIYNASSLKGLGLIIKQKTIKYAQHPKAFTYLLWSLFILCCLLYLKAFLRFCIACKFNINRWIGFSPVAFMSFLFLIIFGTNPSFASTNGLEKQTSGIPDVGTLFFHQDHSHSTSLTTDANGNESSRTSYTPYGKIYKQSGTDNFRSKYGGKELEKEIGLYYYNARYYDPGLGRFISADSQLGGSHLQSDAFNRYAYAFNNPVNYIDPSGHTPIMTKDLIAAEKAGEIAAEIVGETGTEVVIEDVGIDIIEGSLAPETLGISLIVGLVVEVVINVATVVLTTAIDVGSEVLANYVANTATKVSSASSPSIAKATMTHSSKNESKKGTNNNKGGEKGNGNSKKSSKTLKKKTSLNSGSSSGNSGSDDEDNPNNNRRGLSRGHYNEILLPPEIVILIAEFSHDFTYLRFYLASPTIFRYNIEINNGLLRNGMSISENPISKFHNSRFSTIRRLIFVLRIKSLRHPSYRSSDSDSDSDDG